MKRQHLKLVALACSAVFGLAACGSSGGSDSAPNFSGADAGGTIFGNGFAKNNNGSNGNGNNNAGNNANNCGIFGCSPSNPGNNGSGNNNSGGNNNGNANNNNGGGNAQPAPQFVYNGMGVYYAASRPNPNLNRGSQSNPLQLTTVKETKDLDTLDIDGFIFQVSKPKNNLSSQHTLNSYRYVAGSDDLGLTTNTAANNMRYSRFGAAIRSHDYTNPSSPDLQTNYFFSVGDVTPASSMPTSGTAHYSGVSSDSVTLERHVNFNVDFGAKTVDGTVSGHLNANGDDGNSVAFRLHGNIDGSSFSGIRHQTENTTDSDAIMNMKGRFYGPQAEEMGGVYYGKTGSTGYREVSGAFGAKRN